MASTVQPPPPKLPTSFSRTGGNGSSVETMQLDPSALGSFAARPSSFTSASSVQAAQQHSRFSLGNGSHQNTQNSAAPRQSPYSSFGDMNVNGQVQQQQPTAVPQIYSAVYSSVSVYEMEVNGVAVMRRRQDSWLNATQILKVAGVDKGKRTKVLEKEILNGEHEKIQGGYGKYQGTWVNYPRGREFCRQYGVEDVLRPLLEYDMGADGTGVAGQADTPTKEQAMAASRKHFYNSGIHGRANSSASNGTFFQNISPTASNALAAMSKASRFDSPTSRPGSAQRRPNNMMRRASHQHTGSQEAVYPGASQQSMPSVRSEGSFNANGYLDPGGPKQNGSFHVRSADVVRGDGQEPPRKKMRPSSSQENYSQVGVGADISMRDGTPTEPNDSFNHQSSHPMVVDSEGGHTALPPLPAPRNKSEEEKKALLLDILGDGSATDNSNHPAILHLSGQDFDVPLDQSANTALHWAASLARVPLMRLLISKGANIARGNIAGETPLMAAVGVNNSLDHSCFPEMLEILAPLIEVCDARGRTILHHIAVSCGIKGRSASSKYYLEALLEFIVRRGGHSNSRTSSFDPSQPGAPTIKPIGIARFMSEMVNARDRAGNTALNLVARIGNRNIIHQLLEVGADATMPNHKGLRPVDFGVGSEADLASHQPFNHPASPEKSQKTPASRIEETSRDIISSMTSLLNQTSSQFSSAMRTKQDIIDATNAKLRELSALQKDEMRNLENLQRRVKERSERQQRKLNLRRAIEEQKTMLARNGISANLTTRPTIGHADTALPAGTTVLSEKDLPSPSSLTSPLTPAQATFLTSLPAAAQLRTLIAAYSINNSHLSTTLQQLKERSGELEAKYRKVVSLCTGVEEHEVEGMLGKLVEAVESERFDVAEEGKSRGGAGSGGGEGGGGDRGQEGIGRVREFLKRLDGR